MKYPIVLLAVMLSGYVLGCDPDLSESVDSVVSNAPEVCENYCNNY